ncbi:MAG TPA: radical SAM protein [bacterium]|nr:radical SAM protein [bacterium]
MNLLQIPAWKDRIRYNRWLRGAATAVMACRRFPAVLGIDPSGECNLRCDFCAPAVRRAGDRPAGDGPRLLDYALFEQVIDESLRHGRRMMIIMHNWGEPLLHPRLAEMVRHIKTTRAALQVQFSTNGVLLTEDTARVLIEAGLDGLVISVDAADAATYAARKGSDRYQAVMENVRGFMRVRQTLQRSNPFVSAKMIRGLDAPAAEQSFLDQWQPLVDRALLTKPFDWGGAVPQVPVPAAARARYACHFLWYYPVINWDGSVNCCCASCHPAAKVGNVREMPLAKI